MKRQELLKIIDNELLEKIFGFCYVRTNDSYEAQELCSDIVFALVKTANTEGDVHNPYPFIWRIARNVYADFSRERKRREDTFYRGDPQELLPFIAQEEDEADSEELLHAVYRQIAFLTKAYREVMILYYLDGLSTSRIASIENISETAVRQRLFTARKKIRSEVEKMEDTNRKPVALDNINFVIWGTGNPGWGDPIDTCTRQFSKHIVWLCRQKPMTAAEIAHKLNVPTLYVEEELEILTRGTNGQYGFLRQLENGRYAINIVLFDREDMAKGNEIYMEQMPAICNVISAYIEKHRKAYLAFPYRNKTIDLNLILWQQVFTMSQAFSEHVERILAEKYFGGLEKIDRPFSSFGYVDNGNYYGGGWDGVTAHNVCGYSEVHLDNIYITRIQPHFHCDFNVAQDLDIQLAIRAIDGLNIDALSEDEKEHAAKAIACGYLYRQNDMLYTKILVNDKKDSDRLFDISKELSKGYFEAEAQAVAQKISRLIRDTVPEYLLGEWRLANILSNLPVLDALVEVLIEKGLLTPPEDGIGAEGCWMSIQK